MTKISDEETLKEFQALYQNIIPSLNKCGNCNIVSCANCFRCKRTECINCEKF